MDGADDDDDIKLIKASAGLLYDLERDLPKALWKPARSQPGKRKPHRYVRQCDLARLLQLIEPFQGDPQLLDAKLKTILPPIVDAYLEFLHQGELPGSSHHDFHSAVSALIYTLCKVRGHKIVVGFLSNEPKNLEPILAQLEQTALTKNQGENGWQLAYVLLLWLSHLLLAPFDLSSISATQPPADPNSYLRLHQLPPLAQRVLRVGLIYVKSPTKAQDAAASMLVRLAIRPDILHARLADSLVDHMLPLLPVNTAGSHNTYELLGALKLVSGVAAAAELVHLIPAMYKSCMEAFGDDSENTFASNAVAKKIAIKILRNIAAVSLRSANAKGRLLDFVQSTDVLESVIDHTLCALADKDTPVRYAAAKAISLLVLELDSEMGHEVIQAVLDSFKEDMPRSAEVMDFATTNPLKWHGLTLALAHTLFKRSASTKQLPDIFDALLSALNYQQRTSTGTMLGTNIRDAANFGIWSLARRYTTEELLSVSAESLLRINRAIAGDSIIQVLATQLILSACLDPAGNIRRGSSAALQEVVGRHPNKVIEGIPLVQVVDYQAVSLRSRAMIDVASKAAALHPRYWQAVLSGLLGWRGLGSADVSSRESTATCVASLALSVPTSVQNDVLGEVLQQICQCSSKDLEQLHGLALLSARIMADARAVECCEKLIQPAFEALEKALTEFSPRMLRSEYPAAIAQFIIALCNTCSFSIELGTSTTTNLVESVDSTVDRLLARRESFILAIVPEMVESLFRLQRMANMPLNCLSVQSLATAVARDGAKNTLQSSGRALALGRLASAYDAGGLRGPDASAAAICLCGLLSSTDVDWRIVGARALHLMVQSVGDAELIDPEIAMLVSTAVHNGLHDYTIDERGDIGSLVRLQCISCASQIMSTTAFVRQREIVETLEADVYRLCLEKLDRVRLHAAQCFAEHLTRSNFVPDVASVSSQDYFRMLLKPVFQDETPAHIQQAIVQGCTSCAGAGAESIIQASRDALVEGFQAAFDTRVEHFLTVLTNVMKDQLSSTVSNLQPALALLGFLFDMQIPQRLSTSSTFKWRNLLSVVQKAHHKTNDLPKILAAVHVYIGLADVPALHPETMKKLLSMLKSNPYPHVRVAVAEAIFVATGEETVLKVDWNRSAKENASVVESLMQLS